SCLVGTQSSHYKTLVHKSAPVSVLSHFPPVYPHNRRFPAVSFCLLFLSEYRLVLLVSDGSFRFSSALQDSTDFPPDSVRSPLLSLYQSHTLFVYPSFYGLLSKCPH